MRIVVFDLDNCLANDEHRLSLIDWHLTGMARYERYHAKCFEDECANVSLFVGMLKEHSPDLVAFVTGRPAAVRRETEAWLKKHLGHLDFRYRLIMRDDDDDRSTKQLKRSQIFRLMEHGMASIFEIVVAYDDHDGVLDTYRSMGIKAIKLAIHSGDAYNPPNGEVAERPHGLRVDQPFSLGVDQLLEAAAETYRQRNAQYKEGWKQYGTVMQALHPDGVTLKTAKDHETFHLHMLQVVKTIRFASSGMTHKDSVRDGIVYGGMLECSLTDNNQSEKQS